MTRIDEKTIGNWAPFAPIALGILLAGWAAFADHGSIASYNDAWAPGATTLITEFGSLDNEVTLQASYQQR
jgi:hypothetical protein